MAVNQSWNRKNVHAKMRARKPAKFIAQHISSSYPTPVSIGAAGRHTLHIAHEEQFWRHAQIRGFEDVVLEDFTVTDWFPRTPGLYWSDSALQARSLLFEGRERTDPALGDYLIPDDKMALIEDGGIGTVRLRPRWVDGQYCWFATALKASEVNCGIPLAIPDDVIRKAGVSWGDRVTIRGRLRFLFDFGLDEIAAQTHHARLLLVFAEHLKGVKATPEKEHLLLAPVVLFDSSSSGYQGRLQYAFSFCGASDKWVDRAAEWIERYAIKHQGRVITNFDEQRPTFADAPLSYQRLVARTHDRTVIEHFVGTIQADRIEWIVQHMGGIHVGHNINVGGSAIINIDSVIRNVVQVLGGAAPGLDSEQKAKLEELVKSMKSELDKVKASHTDETRAIADALQKTVEQAVKPAQERKNNLLRLSANGLKEAAELVKDVAPSILTTAGLIANFVVGLH
jgi:hypothetical protein